MSEAQHSLKLHPSCQVCFQEFEEDEYHVPRILPCSHTLCHACIGQLIEGNRIECPECRKKHKAINRERSFPQNKYVLTLMKRSTYSEQQISNEFEKCEEHGKEMNLFCKERDCGKPICRLCLTKYHKKHDVIDIEEKEKENLMKDLEKIELNLKTEVEMMLTAKKNIGEKAKTVKEEITTKKEEFDRHFEKMFKKAEEHNRLQNMLIDDEVSAINSSIDLLRSLRGNSKDKENASFRKISKTKDTVKGIVENSNTNLSGERSFWYPVVTMNKSSAEEVLTGISREKVTIFMPDLQKEMEEQQIPKTIANASDHKCAVVTTGGKGLLDYNTMTDKLEWEVQGKVPGREKEMDAIGLSANVRGHLCDYKNGNQCIQMFSASDGRYLGCPMKGVEAIGDPAMVHCEDTPSRLEACFLQGKWHLHFINIQHYCTVFKGTIQLKP